MGKFPFKRPRIISKKFPEIDSSIDGVTKSLNDLVFSYHEQVGKALLKKHWLMAFSSIALLLVLGSFISMHGKADSSVFYPETCLGGWINPDNAQGEQETTSNGDESQFTKDNSAILPRNTDGDMYCGNFKGKFDEATRPTKIIVSLALTKGLELTDEELFETGKKVATATVIVPEISPVTASSTLTLATSTDDVSTSTESIEVASSTAVGTSIATPGASKTDTPSVVEGVIESLKDTIHDIFNTSDTVKTQTDTVVVPPPVVPEQTPQEPSPETPSVPTESPTSYLLKKGNILSYFVGTVFAEEVAPAAPESLDVAPVMVTEAAPLVEVAPEKIPEATTSTPSVSEQVEHVLGIATTTENIHASTTETTSTTTDITIATTTDVNASTTFAEPIATTTEDYQSQNNFLEVFYTFDGEVWKSLGVLNEISMKYRTFEIPVTASTSWADMSKLQIKIEARKHDHDTPVVYLDGVKVEVLYETTFEHVHPDFTRDTILKDETIEGMRIVTIINNDTNREEVWYMYLDTTSTITGETSTSSLLTSSSTLLASTTNVVVKPDIDEKQNIVATSTFRASSTLSFATSTLVSTSTSSTTPFIKPVIPKNVWLKFDGKVQGLLGSQLVEMIKKIDQSKLENKDDDRVPDFTIDTVKKIRGTLLEAIVVQIRKDTADELWLYNIENNTQEKIKTGTSTSISSTYPLGVKGGYLFWLSNDESKVYAYNFESKVILEKNVPPFDGSKGERASVAFEEIAWKVIVTTEGFFFFSEGSGEVFSDENSGVVEAFRKKFNLDVILNTEELNDLNLPSDETEKINNEVEDKSSTEVNTP